MKRFCLLAGCAVLFATGACNSEKISKLEKQNQELQAAIAKEQSATAEYDL
jgi:hypothetical protein